MAVEWTARVRDVLIHAKDTRSLILEPSHRIDFAPGQFVSCQVPHEATVLNRPYSIASTPTDPHLELLLNLVPGGPGSTHLFARRPGDTLRLTGPWGTFITGDLPGDAETIFIAEETAIAPIRPMLLEVARRPSRPPLRLLYGTSLALYRDELAALPGLTIDVVPPATLYTEAARRWIDDDLDKSRRFFICGVGTPVLTLRDRLRAAGHVRRAVQYERW
jgi:ferredoxin-NADP reductase